MYVLRIIHLNIVLGEAEGRVLREEGTVATIENVDFRKGKFWVRLGVGCPILLSDELRHERSTVSGIFAVEYQQGICRTGLLKQLRRQSRLVIVVDRTIDMSTFKFVLKAAVHNHSVGILCIEFPVNNFEEGFLGDPGYRPCVSVLVEVGQE